VLMLIARNLDCRNMRAYGCVYLRCLLGRQLGRRCLEHTQPLGCRRRCLCRVRGDVGEEQQQFGVGEHLVAAVARGRRSYPVVLVHAHPAVHHLLHIVARDVAGGRPRLVLAVLWRGVVFGACSLGGPLVVRVRGVSCEGVFWRALASGLEGRPGRGHRVGGAARELAIGRKSALR
jgi:hypothetical protein